MREFTIDCFSRKSLLDIFAIMDRTYELSEVLCSVAQRKSCDRGNFCFQEHNVSKEQGMLAWNDCKCFQITVREISKATIND